MTRRIFQSIVLAALVVFVVTLGLYMNTVYGYFSAQQREEVRRELELMAHGVELSGYGYLEGLQPEKHRLTLIAADGTVLYDSTSTEREWSNHAERDEVRLAMRDGYGESDRFSNTLLERYFYAAQRLQDGSVLRLSVQHGLLVQLLLGMRLPMLVSIILALLLSFWLAGRLARQIVRPLNELDLENPQINQAYKELSPLLLKLEEQQTELKDRQVKLLLEVEAQERDEARRREFTASVSHELKTPLQSISGYSELLQAGMVPAGDVQHFGASIYHEAQRLIQLVADLLSLSQLDEGAQGMPWETVDLTEMLRNVRQQLEPLAQHAGVQLILRAEQVSLRSIRPLLQTLVTNLCDNAIKYNVRGGKVTITLVPGQNEAVLTVADTGIGIPYECQSRVFERFYRVDKGRSRAAGGTGLGLSIVKHAASVLGARLDLESQEGEGTVITVHLPR